VRTTAKSFDFVPLLIPIALAKACYRPVQAQTCMLLEILALVSRPWRRQAVVDHKQQIYNKEVVIV